MAQGGLFFGFVGRAALPTPTRFDNHIAKTEAPVFGFPQCHRGLAILLTNAWRLSGLVGGGNAARPTVKA